MRRNGIFYIRCGQPGDDSKVPVAVLHIWQRMEGFYHLWQENGKNR